MDVLLTHLSRGDKRKNVGSAKGSRSASEDSGYCSMSERDRIQLEKDLRKEAFHREALCWEALNRDAVRRARKRWITFTPSPSNTLRPKSLPPVPLRKLTPPAFEIPWSGSRTPSPERKKPPSPATVPEGVEVAKTRVRKNITALEHPHHTFSQLFDQCDGTSDELDPFLEPETLPRLKSGSRFSSNTTRRVRPPLKTFATYPTTGSVSSLRTPDRFLPSRRPNLKSATESFRVGKDPNKLSTDEKLLRSKEASPDAFNPRRRVSLPVVSANRPSRSQNRRPVSGERVGLATILGVPTANQDQIPSSPTGQRQASAGTIWSVGGLAPGVSDGRGRMLSSGSNAPLYTTSFSSTQIKAQQIAEQHVERLSAALNLDRAQRILEFREPSVCPTPNGSSPKSKHTDALKTTWTGTGWTMGGREQKAQRIQELRSLPEAPFKVLDAPNLRDDFYCSILAYSSTCHTLAVGLGTILYSWSERTGVLELNRGNGNGAWLTSIAFSSTNGHKSILAFGRSDSTLSLISLPDSLIPRFQVRQMHPIACITWRPTVTIRGSKSPVNPGMLVKTEDLLVGDEQGNIYCYAVEWPFAWEVSRDTWSGCMTLVAKISTHDQQICGLAFSPDGYTFATGGNDNLCCLFKTEIVFPLNGSDPEMVLPGLNGVRLLHSVPGEPAIRLITRGAEEYRWVHGAAVKAIAFCPWRDNLLATGGGSNDKCIHFFHTLSGACLAKISVAAQVTSLIWSTTRREIAATFGYAQPEHPYRIAIFSWPECEQVAAIRWEGEHRALYAIAYPGGPNESHHTSREGGSGLTRTAKEGCIVVASSNESIKFHEVWSAGQKATTGGVGLLGGSDILEGLEGVDREMQIIR